LLRLLKRQQDKAAQPDLIVFEYALNDIILAEGGCLGMDLLRDTLEEITQHCAERKIGLLFLMLAPRNSKGQSLASSARVTREYAKTARARGMFPSLTLSQILGGPPTVSCYQDPYHLTPEVSGLVAQSLRVTLRKHEIPAPMPAPERRPIFCYVQATKARAAGSARLRQRESKVFKGLFLEMARPSVSYWPGRGLLVALMLRSSETAGVFKVSAGSAAYRKTAASIMQETVSKLLLLHHMSHPIYVNDDLEISMPDDEASLMALPEDKTSQQAAPAAQFAEQLMEINGVLLWRGRSLWERCHDAISLAARRVFLHARERLQGRGSTAMSRESARDLFR